MAVYHADMLTCLDDAMHSEWLTATRYYQVSLFTALLATGCWCAAGADGIPGAAARKPTGYKTPGRAARHTIVCVRRAGGAGTGRLHAPIIRVQATGVSMSSAGPQKPKAPRRDGRNADTCRTDYTGMAAWLDSFPSSIANYEKLAGHARNEAQGFREGARLIEAGEHPKLVSGEWRREEEGA